MNSLLIFPFGGNAREIVLSIIEINKLYKTWNIIGFLDDNKELWGKKFINIPVLGGLFTINKYPGSYILAVPGNPNTYNLRNKIINKLKLPISRFASIIDPSARISPDTKIGKNTAIMANVVISTGVKIGNHCVILPNTVIAHDSKINNYSMIGANVTVSGSACIEENCYIGSGCNIKENIRIGKGSLIGLGSNVVNNIPKNVVAVGNPAKTIRRI